MKHFTLTLTCMIMLLSSPFSGRAGDPPSYFTWGQLPPLPDPAGLAGVFAGVSNGVLLVAGGSNFPEGGTPWNGGIKQWHDRIYALETPGGAWKEAGRLPHPMGYGVSLSWRDGLVLLGGSDAAHCYAQAMIGRYANGNIQWESLPDLPAPLANACGVLIGDKIYLAGGITTPGAVSTENHCWILDLSAARRRWETGPPCPGPSRMLAVAGTLEGDLYLFSGVHLRPGPGDSAQREFLTDAWRYTAGKGWHRLADLPEAVAAAPGPAFVAGQEHLLIFGGDNGRYFTQNAQLKETHPGFPGQIWSYHALTDTWAPAGNLPVTKKADAVGSPQNSDWAPVTTPAFLWNGWLIIPGGEIRPGARTARVLTATPVQAPGVFAWKDWLVVAIYFLLVVTVSIVVSGKMKGSTDNFFLGGGKIPWWAAGLSIFGSKLSALTFIAIPAKAYATDWVYMLTNLLIVAVAPVIVYFYLPYFRKLRLTSVYEYLGIRFDQRVRWLGSFTFLVFQISRLGIVIYLPALVLSAVTGLSLLLCITGVTLLTTAYSVAGGIEAVVWTEVMQVGVLLGGALISLVYIAHAVPGGFDSLFSEALAAHKLRLLIGSGPVTVPVWWVILVGGFLTQLVTYSSDQVVVQRYLTTSSEKEARRSIYTNAVLVIPATFIFFSVGTALWVYFKHFPGQLDPLGRTDDIFPWFISTRLPSGLSGLVIAGVFAATMSTISSSMNSIATVVTTDFYAGFRPASTDRQRLRFARGTTLLLGVVGCAIAIYMAWLHNSSIWDQYIKVIGLFGGCLAGMFVAGIFFPSISAKGILAGFAGSAVVLYIVQRNDWVNFFLYPAIAIVLCVFFGWIFSASRRAP